jgi:uncharacterized phage protein (TIGR01671 family)
VELGMSQESIIHCNSSVREIKFKAWNPQNQEMYSPYCIDLMIHLNGVFQSLDDKGLIKGTINTPQLELLQYTELKDISGKEIYDKDIILRKDTKLNSKYIGVITFGVYGEEHSENHLGFYVNWITKCAKDFRKDLTYWNKKVKVIGNIYQNKKLLF